MIINNKINTFLIGLLFKVVIVVPLVAQVKIGDNPDDLNDKALLELSSTDKGLKLSIINNVKTLTSFGSDEIGMVMYDNLTSKVYHWNDSSWLSFTGGKFFKGDSSSDQAVYVNLNNPSKTKVGINLNDPKHILHVDGDSNISTKYDNVVVLSDGSMVVGGDGSNVTPGAILEIQSSRKGLLLPSVLPSKLGGNIANEAMLIFDATAKSMRYYAGTLLGWKNISGKFTVGYDSAGENQNYAVFEGQDPAQTSVGIGNSDPLSTLHITGTLKSDILILSEGAGVDKILKSKVDVNAKVKGYDKSYWDSNFKIAIINDPSNNRAYIKDKSDAKKRKNVDGNAFVIQDDGKWGIATESPSEQLEVNGDVLIEKEATMNGLTISDGNPEANRILMAIENDGTAQWTSYPLYRNPTKKMIYTKFFSDGSIERKESQMLVIDDDGNVGIGTDSPTKKLDVKNNVKIEGRFTTKDITITDGAGDKKILISNDTGLGNWEIPAPSPFESDSTTSITYLRITSDGKARTTIGTEFVVKDDGKVGIGTRDLKNLTEKLNVNGNARTLGLITNVLKLDTGADVEGKVLTSDADGKASWKYPPMVLNATKKQVYIPSKSTNKSDGTTDRTDGNSFIVLDNGSVGLGKIPEKYKLEIKGNTIDDRTIAILGNPVLRLGEETNPSLILGNGLQNMVSTESSENVAVGRDALLSLVGGKQNVAVGYKALEKLKGNNVAGSLNVVIGAEAMSDNISGSLNTVVGYKSGGGIKTGDKNTIIGSNVKGLADNMTKNVIIANGRGEIYIHADEERNTVIGELASKTPQTKIALEVASSVGGFMPPRMTLNQREGIVRGNGTFHNPELIGIMVYDTDLKLLLTWNGSWWVEPGREPGMQMFFDNTKPGFEKIPEGWKKVEAINRVSTEDEVPGSFVMMSDVSKINPATTYPEDTDWDEDSYFGRYDKKEKKFYIGEEQTHAITEEETPTHQHKLSGGEHQHPMEATSRQIAVGVINNFTWEQLGVVLNVEPDYVEPKRALLKDNVHKHEAITDGEAYGRDPRTPPKGETYYDAKPHQHDVSIELPKYHVSGLLIEYVGFQ